MKTTWQPGESGNPAGRPPGIPDKRSKLRELFEAAAPEIIGKAIELARSGDINAIKLCLDRLLPALRPAAGATRIDMDPAQPADAQARAILGEIASGRLSVDDGAAMVGAISRRSEIEQQGAIAALVVALAEKGGIPIPAELRVHTHATTQSTEGLQ